MSELDAVAAAERRRHFPFLVAENEQLCAEVDRLRADLAAAREKARYWEDRANTAWKGGDEDGATIMGLFADLAAARRERDAAEHIQADLGGRILAAMMLMEGWTGPLANQIRAALSAGGGGPAEGALIGYRVRLGDLEDDWTLFAPEDVEIVRVGPPADESGRPAATEGRDK